MFGFFFFFFVLILGHGQVKMSRKKKTTKVSRAMQVYIKVQGYLTFECILMNGLVHCCVEGSFSKTEMSLKTQGNNRKIL